jgi:hypothetical protein
MFQSESNRKERERRRKPLKILSSARELNQDLTDTKQVSSPFSTEFRMRGITSSSNEFIVSGSVLSLLDLSTEKI